MPEATKSFSKTLIKKHAAFLMKIKWAQLGTIQRPLDYESSALTS